MNRQYKIPKGKHYQFSLHRLWHRFRPRRVKKGSKLTFTAVFNTDPYNILPDEDQHDRHKLIGMPRKVWSKSNKDAALVSFQPNVENNTWDVCAYYNYDYKWETGEEVKLKKGEPILGTIEFINDYEVNTTLIKPDFEPVEHSFTWEEKVSYTGIILPWHGGKDNNNDGTGGISPIDISISMNWTYTK